MPQRPFYIHFGAQIVQELLPHQVRAPKKGPKMATQHTHKKHTPNNLEMESASAFTKCLFVGCGLLKGLPGGPKPPRSPILFFGCLFREDPQGSPRSSPVAMDPTGLLVWLLCRLCNDADVRTDADVGTAPSRFDVFRRYRCRCPSVPMPVSAADVRTVPPRFDVCRRYRISRCRCQYCCRCRYRSAPI